MNSLPDQYFTPNGLTNAYTMIDDTEDAAHVIEAVFEDMGVKKEALRQLDEVTRKDVIVATNYVIDVYSRNRNSHNWWDRVVGLHFFNSVLLMTLIEIFRGFRTSDETIAEGRLVRL